MIQKSDLLALSFYEKSPFTGSEGPMNYRVEKIMCQDGQEKRLQATVWPGPLCFPLTDDSLKERFEAPFSLEGMEELVKWMNEKAPAYRQDAHPGAFAARS